jgi:hypothetical protein
MSCRGKLEYNHVIRTSAGRESKVLNVKLYTIELKPGGSFTLTMPDTTPPLKFPTKEAALAKVRAMLGEDDFKRVTVSSRPDGGMNVKLAG